MTSPLTTPTASYLFPSHINMTITPPSRAHTDEYGSSPLYMFLSQDGVREEEIVGAVEELCWRGLMEGRRVRGINEEVMGVLDMLKNKSHLNTILSAPPLSTLLPFIPTANNPYFPSLTAAEDSPLLPAFQLNDIDRQQLIDALVKLSRREAKMGDIAEALVGEICLEYVGRRWRNGQNGEEEDLMEDIAKNLTEVEFEIQIQGSPTTVRCFILPAIQKIRFHLGLVNSSQLVIRLQSLATQLDEPFHPLRRPAFHIDQLVNAWLSIRLRIGIDPQSLVDELISVRDRLRHEATREIISTILGQYGLLGRGRSRTDSVLGQTGLVHPSSPSPASPMGKMKRSPSSNKVTTRKTIAGVPKWWPHRRNNSSSSKLQVNSFPNDRRPSLPVISTHSGSTSALSHLPWGRTTTSLNSNSTGGTFTRSRLSLSTNIPTTPERETAASTSTPDLLSSMLTFSDPEDMRFILLDHLLAMKYSISTDSTEDWYLGNGKRSADEIIAELDRKLIRRKDVIGLRGIFTDLRDMFDLPQRAIPAQTPRNRVPSEYTETLVESFPVVPPRELASPLPESISSRASFDLDEYIADITPVHPSPRSSQVYSLQLLSPAIPDEMPTRNPRRSSAGAESVLTMTSTATGHQSVFSIMGALNMRYNQRASMLSSFTIREATREMLSTEKRGVEVNLDNVGKGLRRVASMGTLGVGSGLEVGVEGEGEGYESSYEGGYEIEEMKSFDTPKKHGLNSYRRKSRSETDLSQWTSILNNPNSRSSTMPLRFDLSGSVLRRRERITPKLTSLSAYDLGLQDSLPKTPKSPPHLQGFEFEYTTPKAEISGFDLGESGEKRLNRQFAIVDGEGVSPTKMRDGMGGGGRNALEVIMGLFVLDGGGLKGKVGLGLDEVWRILGEVVEVGLREVGDLEKITWLLEMAREVLDDAKYEAAFQTILSNLKNLDQTSIKSTQGHSPYPPEPDIDEPRQSLDSIYSSEEGGSISTHSSFSTGMAFRPLLRVGGGVAGSTARTISCFSTGTFGKRSREFERGK